MTTEKGESRLAGLWTLRDNGLWTRECLSDTRDEVVLRVGLTEADDYAGEVRIPAGTRWRWDGLGAGATNFESAKLAQESADRYAFEASWALQFTVKLAYFKRSGKYYTHGEYVTSQRNIFEVWDEVVSMRRDNGRRPGLCDSTRDEFHVLVDVPGHPHEHPRLILAAGGE